jgi:hypothetical protein
MVGLESDDVVSALLQLDLTVMAVSESAGIRAG